MVITPQNYVIKLPSHSDQGLPSDLIDCQSDASRSNMISNSIIKMLWGTLKSNGWLI